MMMCLVTGLLHGEGAALSAVVKKNAPRCYNKGFTVISIYVINNDNAYNAQYKTQVSLTFNYKSEKKPLKINQPNHVRKI